MTTCPICNRMRGDDVSMCRGTYTHGCVVAAEAEAYLRGLRDGVALAKRTAMTRDDYSINWRETDREAAKMAGEGT